jgi:hypothetical protein
MGWPCRRAGYLDSVGKANSLRYMKKRLNGLHSCDQLQKIELFGTCWIDFVHSQPNATCFHHPAWAGLLADCYGYQAFALALIDGAGRIVAGLPVIEVTRPWGERRWVSLPFTDHCTPLATDDQTLQNLVVNLVEAKKTYHLSSIQVRADLKMNGAGGDSFNSQSDAFLHTLRLQADAQSLFRRFKKTVQQVILKAEREGLSMHWGNSLCDLEVFYSLHVGTRWRLGVPVQPKRFFDLLWDRILSTGLGFLLIVYKDDRPIAGAIFLTWNGVIIYKYSASDHKFLRLRPNNLLLWYAICWGCDNGYHTFDFGRTDAENTGLRKFKSGWGGTNETPLVYSVVGSRPTKFSSGRMSKVLSGVIRCLPPWVCRATGELFYKFTA